LNESIMLHIAHSITWSLSSSELFANFVLLWLEIVEISFFVVFG
jgi:hypothetical protein